MHFLERVCPMFLNGLPTVNRSCVPHINRVFRVERGHGGGIVVVDCLGILLTDRNKLLDYLWIDRVFLLSEGRQSKADCQPATTKRIFIVSSRGAFWTTCRLPTCFGISLSRRGHRERLWSKVMSDTSKWMLRLIAVNEKRCIGF